MCKLTDFFYLEQLYEFFTESIFSVMECIVLVHVITVVTLISVVKTGIVIG